MLLTVNLQYPGKSSDLGARKIGTELVDDNFPDVL